MTIGDLIKNKDYDYVEYRVIPPLDTAETMFFGAFKSVSGEIISLDGNTYHKSEEVLSYEEWSNPEKGIENGLTIIVDVEWI